MTDRPPMPAQDVTPDRAGRMAGEYRLGRKLGEGGFGAVYEAVHPLLKRRAAVKVLHRGADPNSEAVQRFIAEAQAVNQIRSPHIVDIFSFGQLSDGRHFYVMDLLEGEPLDRFLAHAGRVDVSTALQLLRPIGEALDAAHAAGIVHRDLKPQNIFLAWNAQGLAVPTLLDFGMAKLLGDAGVNTVSGTPLGTPLYMSPEQARGQKVDQRSDIYALGVLVHELLTGQLPIIGDTTIAVLMAHIHEEPAPVSKVCPDLPAALDAPILQMLAKQPEQRPVSASAALLGVSAAAEAAGIAITSGLPELPRPAPVPESARPGELSGTLAADSPSAQLTPQPPSAPPVRSPRRMRWFSLGAVIALALGAMLLAMRDGATRQAEPAGANQLVPDAAQDPPPSLPSATPALAAPPEAAREAVSVTPDEAPPELPDALRPDAGAPSARRKKSAGPATRIPRDLENPF
ncbi:MAG TPA: protein kinase [Polyangiales bacterium]